MVKHRRRGVIRWFLLIFCLVLALIGFQVYSGQSSFIDNLTSSSTFSNFGMPVDNLASDTGVAVSSK
jgi:hypothetical protein